MTHAQKVPTQENLQGHRISREQGRGQEDNGWNVGNLEPYSTELSVSEAANMLSSFQEQPLSKGSAARPCCRKLHLGFIDTFTPRAINFMFMSVLPMCLSVYYVGT